MNNRDMPSCLRQTLPRETYHPLSLKYGPSMMPDAKQRDDMDRSDAALLTMQGEKMGNVDIDRSKLVDRAVFAMRGFGEF